MGPMSEGEDCGDSVNLSGKKRFNGDNEGGDSKGKKVRILEIIDETFEVLDGFDGEKKGIIGNEAMGFGEDMNLNGKGVSCSGDEKNMDIDLNVATIDLEDDEFVPVGVERRVEIIDIPSDESDVEEVREIAPEDVKGKGKQIEDGFAYESIENFDFGLGLMEGNVGGNSFLSDGRRYTRDEKGKSKDYDFWLSLATNPTLFELQRGTEDSFLPEVQPGSQDLIQFEVQPESHDLIQFEVQQGSHASVQFELEPGSQLNEDIDQLERLRLTIEQERRNAESVARQLDILRNARRFARVEDNGEASANQEKAPLEDDSLLGKSPGPFSTALKMVRERKSSRPEQLIDWKPSNNGRNAFRPPVSSLLDLSMKALAGNAEAIVSLELVPDILKQGLADLICNLRKMNNHTFELLVKGSPTEIRIKDCSWLTEDQFLKTFGDFDAKSLTVLQVELCGQCTLDNVMSKTLAKFSKSLPNLGVISLKGACRLSNNGIKALVRSAPALQSINLSQCSLLTDVGINILADSLGSMLRELFIDDCQKIDAMLILPALKKFENLEVLSIAGIQTVSDQFVDGLITARGSKIKELDFANCLGLSNYSLKVIGDSCTGLLSLNISDLDKLTDLGLQFLADGCRCIQTLKLCRNKFSDDAIAAFLEASGESLKEFSLNNVTLVGPCTAFSLAKCSRKLLGLDLSWCRKITNEALGLIVDSCLSLKLVKLFGCTQITSVFLNGHSNPQVQIIGLQLTPILENANELEPSKVLLRYSPLEFLPREPPLRLYQIPVSLQSLCSSEHEDDQAISFSP